MPLGQGGGILVQVVSAAGDEAVDAARDRRRIAAVSDEEGSLIALDDRFRGGRGAQKGLTLFEAGNKLLPVKRIRTRSDYHLGRSPLEI